MGYHPGHRPRNGSEEAVGGHSDLLPSIIPVVHDSSS